MKGVFLARGEPPEAAFFGVGSCCTCSFCLCSVQDLCMCVWGNGSKVAMHAPKILGTYIPISFNISVLHWFFSLCKCLILATHKPQPLLSLHLPLLCYVWSVQCRCTKLKKMVHLEVSHFTELCCKRKAIHAKEKSHFMFKSRWILTWIRKRIQYYEDEEYYACMCL